MYILLYLLAQAGSQVARGVTFMSHTADLLIKIGEKGYTVSGDSLNEVIKEHYDEMKKKNKVVSKVIAFVPVVNAFYTRSRMDKLEEAILNDPNLESTLLPLTEEEKEKFNSVDEGDKRATKYKKASMILDFSKAKENDESYKVERGTVANLSDEEEKEQEKEKDNVTVLEERLLPLAYTLDEVKLLNDATEGNLILGTNEGSRIAIIGVPEDVETIENVKLADSIQHDKEFVPLTEEECKDSCFLVYPYNNDHKKEIEWAIERIRKDRKIQSEIPRIEFKPTETVEPDISREHSAPTLMKSLGRMKF